VWVLFTKTRIASKLTLEFKKHLYFKPSPKTSGNKEQIPQLTDVLLKNKMHDNKGYCPS
jgi:hypothetical protein